MQRGLFYQLAPPSFAAYQALRDEVRLAEMLGLERVFCLPRCDDDGGFSGASPAVWLAALAAETERIRLGWGVAGLFPPADPPVREAEQAATLDVAGGGRLDVAVLPSAGAASEEGRADDDEGVRMLVDMWAPATFSWTSPRFSVPPIDVVPKPVQRPHPPLWLIGWNAEHAGAAGQAGMAFLDVSGGGASVWQAHRALYAEARAEAPVGALVSAGEFAVAVDLAQGSEAALGASSATGWLAEFEALEVDAVVLCAGPVEGGHAEACRRIRWLAEG